MREELIKREDGRVRLDLDEYYPPPHMHPNTVFKSIAIAFRAMGADPSYVEPMGISAAAFRIRVGGYLCPSSPHPDLGFSCAALAREALGHHFVDYEWKPRHRSEARAAMRAVVESIDRGAPALTAEEETGLVVGYQDDGRELLVRHPYSCKGDPPEPLGDMPVWGFGVIAKLPEEPTVAPILRNRAS